MSRLVVGLLVAALAFGCARELHDLQPFPCAKNGACPGGLACIPGVGCAPAQIDTPCDATIDCASAAPGAICEQGFCTTACGTGCPQGRNCTGLNAGVCAADCTLDAGCSAGLVCKDLWYYGRRGCLPLPLLVPACRAFEASGPAAVCGFAGSTVQCQGFRCPSNSQCAANSRCVCSEGFEPRECTTGESCFDVVCAASQWWCLPPAVTHACASAGDYVPGTFRCADDRTSPASCGGAAECERVCRSVR